MGKWNNNTWEWDIGWRREWFVWEMLLVELDMLELTKFKPKLNGDDGWKWNGEKLETYSLKSTYMILYNSTGCEGDKYFSHMQNKCNPKY